MKRIETELLVVQRLYVDTAPLIYYVEENSAYVEMMRKIVRTIDETDLVAYSSVLTLAEVLVMPFREGDQRLIRAYQEILIAGDDYELVAVTPEIAVTAAETRARYGLGTPDSLHVATAIATHCDAMLTNDSDMKRISELSILMLDDLEP
ncbi:MAG: PIN domain-containing protein [Chloroflexota bacterium]|nr:PIN domain-containing protein [Chloroflexota bacterium]MDE2947799.1 PIN domain-containing protein [Chloroflexota bacterium]